MAAGDRCPPDGKKSALITEYCSPETASHLVWWPMELVEDRMLFQNHLLFLSQRKEPFFIENALSFVRDRQSTNSEGEKLSEWSVPLSEIVRLARTIGLGISPEPAKVSPHEISSSTLALLLLSRGQITHG
jgi:hypothetical protein